MTWPVFWAKWPLMFYFLSCRSIYTVRSYTLLILNRLKNVFKKAWKKNLQTSCTLYYTYYTVYRDVSQSSFVRQIYLFIQTKTYLLVCKWFTSNAWILYGYPNKLCNLPYNLTLFLQLWQKKDDGNYEVHLIIYTGMYLQNLSVSTWALLNTLIFEQSRDKALFCSSSKR